jgi:hypothetical protein
MGARKRHLYTVEEFADWFKAVAEPAAVRLWIAEGLIETLEIGGYLRIPWPEFYRANRELEERNVPLVTFPDAPRRWRAEVILGGKDSGR